MPRLFKDPFTEWLEAREMKPRVYQPGGMMGFPPLGWQVRLRRSSIAYVVRQESLDTLLIIMFERDHHRVGLGSPFADFVRFVSLVKSSGVGIKRIQGRVHAPEDRPADSMEVDRMSVFYHRHLGGFNVPEQQDDSEVVWVFGELDGLQLPFRNLREPRL